MLRQVLICSALLAWMSSVCLAQEPKPKAPPPDGSQPRNEGFGPGPAGPGSPGGPGGGPRGGKGGPQGERGKAGFTNNPPFGGRGPMGGGPGGPKGGGSMEGGPGGFRPGMMGPRMSEYDRLREEDPEMHALYEQDQRLENETLQVAEQLRRATSEQHDKLKTQLTELVNKHFDVRQQRRELQLKRMETELSRLRDAIKQRNDGRDKIIKERLTELVGESKDLGF